jgi:hypothetical protein
MRSIIKKLINIVKSRFIQDSKLPKWHKKRLKDCNSCKHNFKNVPLLKRSFKDYSWFYLNGFNNQCTICNCGIKFKTRIKEEYCSLENIGETPKWDIEK